MKKGITRVGTSNIVLPGNKQSFPAGFRNSSRLRYYSSLFNTVEINSSFYKLPKAATFQKWAADTLHHFVFSVKLSKAVTHAKALKFDLQDVETFLTTYSMPADKKGPLLIQFPGKIDISYYSQVETLLNYIRQRQTHRQLQLAVEFRSSSWYINETMEMLDAFNTALVLHDMPKSKIFLPNKKAPFIYLRLHGQAGDYRGSYDDHTLQHYAQLVKAWNKKGKNVYVYFNNTIGAAFDNAVHLQQLCG